jgi:hypothetical protein
MHLTEQAARLGIEISEDRSNAGRRRRLKRPRARTIGRRELPVVQTPTPAHWRPSTRAECPEFRPCPFVGCRHHLYLEVTATGGIKLKFPHLQPWELRHSCSLDLAELGGLSPEIVASVLNLTREGFRLSFLRARRRFAEAMRRGES